MQTCGFRLIRRGFQKSGSENLNTINYFNQIWKIFFDIIFCLCGLVWVTTILFFQTDIVEVHLDTGQYSTNTDTSNLTFLILCFLSQPGII